MVTGRMQPLPDYYINLLRKKGEKGFACSSVRLEPLKAWELNDFLSCQLPASPVRQG
jgi:hypothetical protein